MSNAPQFNISKKPPYWNLWIEKKDASQTAPNLKNGLSYRSVDLGQNYTQSVTYTVKISGRYNENGA